MTALIGPNAAGKSTLFRCICGLLDSAQGSVTLDGQTLNEWVKKVEVDTGGRAGVTTGLAEKMKALERENRELRQANEILRKASAYFAQAELDRPFRR